ncbi:hypothetical protein DFJ73DRAFT_961117 [Zopfochytrium polystomum]|nr:hypothetical protein DFJ73DRAFT_961117 [Zopfochytrium polystomum]
MSPPTLLVAETTTGSNAFTRDSFTSLNEGESADTEDEGVRGAETDEEEDDTMSASTTSSISCRMYDSTTLQARTQGSEATVNSRCSKAHIESNGPDRDSSPSVDAQQRRPSVFLHKSEALEPARSQSPSRHCRSPLATPSYSPIDPKSIGATASFAQPPPPYEDVVAVRPATPAALIDKDILDSITSFMESFRHRAVEVVMVWSLMAFINFWTAFPIEWLFFLYFSITIFSQAYDLGRSVFCLLVSVIVLADLLIYFTFPFKFTALASTIVVNSFLVYGIQDLNFSCDMDNVGAWLLVLAMMFIRFTFWFLTSILTTPQSGSNDSKPTEFATSVQSESAVDPTYPAPTRTVSTILPLHLSLDPPLFVSVVAAHCSGFGLCYFLWKLGFLVHRNIDRFTYALGPLLPSVPEVRILELDESSVKVNWFFRSSDPDHPNPSTPIAESAFLQVIKFAVELNGTIVGEVSRGDRTVLVTGLSPETRYAVRIWAVRNKRIRTPTEYVFVRTLKQSFAKAIEDRCSTAGIAPTAASAIAAAEAQEKEDEAELARLSSDLAHIEHLLSDTERHVMEANQQFIRDEAALRAQLAELKETRRRHDAPRAEMRAQAKELEDAKVESEVRRRAGLERQVKAARAGLDEVQAQLQALSAEVEKVKAKTRGIEGDRRRKAAAEAAAAEKSLEGKRGEFKVLEGIVREKRQGVAELRGIVRELEEKRSTVEKEIERMEVTSGDAIAARGDRKRRKSVTGNFGSAFPSTPPAQQADASARLTALDQDERSASDLLATLRQERQSLTEQLEQEGRDKLRLLSQLSLARKAKEERDASAAAAAVATTAATNLAGKQGHRTSVGGRPPLAPTARGAIGVGRGVSSGMNSAVIGAQESSVCTSSTIPSPGSVSPALSAGSASSAMSSSAGSGSAVNSTPVSGPNGAGVLGTGPPGLVSMGASSVAYGAGGFVPDLWAKGNLFGRPGAAFHGPKGALAAGLFDSPFDSLRAGLQGGGSSSTVAPLSGTLDNPSASSTRPHKVAPSSSAGTSTAQTLSVWGTRPAAPGVVVAGLASVNDSERLDGSRRGRSLPVPPEAEH